MIYQACGAITAFSLLAMGLITFDALDGPVYDRLNTALKRLNGRHAGIALLLGCVALLSFLIALLAKGATP